MRLGFSEGGPMCLSFAHANPDRVQGLVPVGTTAMVETDVRPLLPGIRTPTRVIHLTGDLAVPVPLGRALAEGLPHAESLEVQGADHADLSQSPEAVARIRAFHERAAGATS